MNKKSNSIITLIGAVFMFIFVLIFNYGCGKESSSAAQPTSIVNATSASGQGGTPPTGPSTTTLTQSNNHTPSINTDIPASMIAAGTGNVATAQAKDVAENTAWESAEKSGTPTAFKEYYQKYPKSPRIKTVTGTLRGRYWMSALGPSHDGVIVTVDGMNLLVNVSLEEAKKLAIINSSPANPESKANAQGFTFNDGIDVEVTTGGDIVGKDLIEPKDSLNSIIVLSADGTRLLTWDVSAAKSAEQPDSHPTFIESYKSISPFKYDPNTIQPP